MGKAIAAGALVLGLVWLGTDSGTAQDDKNPPRFNIPADTELYPQANPKQALESVVKAIDRKRIDYLVAHLADPKFVDDRVKKTGLAPAEGFAAVVKEVAAKFVEDGESVKQLRRFAREGEWMEAAAKASCRLKDVNDRTVLMVKVGERWFLRNEKEDDSAKADKDKDKDK
jgi:hypothetical protein